MVRDLHTLDPRITLEDISLLQKLDTGSEDRISEEQSE
jgi:hypothetical protein